MQGFDEFIKNGSTMDKHMNHTNVCSQLGSWCSGKLQQPRALPWGCTSATWKQKGHMECKLNLLPIFWQNASCFKNTHSSKLFLEERHIRDWYQPTPPNAKTWPWSTGNLSHSLFEGHIFASVPFFFIHRKKPFFLFLKSYHKWLANRHFLILHRNVTICTG